MRVPVPVRHFLDCHSFDPETIQAMSEALADACKTLGLKAKHDAPTRLLAMRIIDLAQDGECDRETLKAAALRGFAH